MFVGGFVCGMLVAIGLLRVWCQWVAHVTSMGYISKGYADYIEYAEYELYKHNEAVCVQ